MNKLKALLLLVCAVFAVMLFPGAVNAASVGMDQDLNNGPVTIPFPNVEDTDFDEGYIYQMTYTAPEDGWYNVTAEGASGLVLGFCDTHSNRPNEFETYENDTTTFREPVLAYKDDPYRAGAVCKPVYLENGEEWNFSVIGKYYGSSYAADASFEVNLVYIEPKITGVTVNKTTVRPGDKVTYSIVFDQNVENWEFTDTYLSEHVYAPNGQDFDVFTVHHDAEITISGNTVNYSYPINKDDHNRIVKLDMINLNMMDLIGGYTYANDSYRSWDGQNIIRDKGYIPADLAVTIETGNCYHDEYPEWWGYGTITKAATYDSEGVITYTCRMCGATRTESIPRVPAEETTPSDEGSVTPSDGSSASGPESSSGNSTASTAVGTSHAVNGSRYKVLTKSTVAFIKSMNKKAITVPATIKVGGKTFKVTQINANAFKGSKIRTVTIGKNVNVIKKNAFKGSKATKIILKTKLLKKAKVKGCLKTSKIKTVQVKIGKKSVNKTYVKKYKKIFTKANVGKKVTVK